MRAAAIWTALFLLAPLAPAAETVSAEDQAQRHINEADTLLEHYDLEAALAHYLQACELDPTASMAFRGAGFALLELGRPLEAIPYLEDAARIDPSASRPVENLGLAHVKVWEDAREELMRLSSRIPAGTIDPEDPLVKRQKVVVETMHGTDWISEGLAYLGEAVEMEPTEAKYWYNLATTLQRFRSTEKQAIVDAYLTALEFDPDYYPALRNLALWMMKRGWYAESREIVQQLAQTVGDDDPFVPEMLGGIAMREGDLDEAETQYLRAFELIPDAFRVNLQLAIVYERRGAYDRSEYYTKRAVALGADSEEFIRSEIKRAGREHR